MSYAYLAIAILAEVIGTSALKASAGFTKFGPSVAVAAGFAAAFFFLSLALRTIPMGIAYAIWGGCGLTLIVIIGAVVFREIPDVGAVIGFALIGTGVVALTLSSRMVAH
jgi:small multidrug resistance pump